MTKIDGEKLKRARIRANKTPEVLVAQVQTQEGVELTYRVYDKMEREGYLPKRSGLEIVEAISHVLGCPSEDFSKVEAA